MCVWIFEATKHMWISTTWCNTGLWLWKGKTSQRPLFGIKPIILSVPPKCVCNLCISLNIVTCMDVCHSKVPGRCLHWHWKVYSLPWFYALNDWQIISSEHRISHKNIQSTQNMKPFAFSLSKMLLVIRSVCLYLYSKTCCTYTTVFEHLWTL